MGVPVLGVGAERKGVSGACGVAIWPWAGVCVRILGTTKRCFLVLLRYQKYMSA